MELVSIIVPMYNAEKYIKETLDSILAQDYQNFEVLCVDDLSDDNTKEIVFKYVNKDSRFKYYSLKEKGGASTARNLAIKKASGKYIAFLDADDVWRKDKLTRQIKFMKENNYSFTYTYFGFIDETSSIKTEYRTSPQRITYSSLLFGNTIGCLTVIYDAETVGLVQIPRIDKRNDYALWLSILKKGVNGYLFPEILSYYRVTNMSLSKKDGKLDLIKYHLFLHRNIEGHGWIKAWFYTISNMLNTFVINLKYTQGGNKNV